MSYDHWKTTNPDDEWLGPDPQEEELIGETYSAPGVDTMREYDEYIEGRETYVERMNTALREKDAEILRLTEENAHYAWREKDKNRLITKLADALDKRIGIPEMAYLIKCAREATK